MNTLPLTRMSLQPHHTRGPRVSLAQAYGSTSRTVVSNGVVAFAAVSREHQPDGVIASGVRLYCHLYQVPAIADIDAALLARVKAEVPNLLESYPLEQYLAFLDSDSGYGGYSRVSKSVKLLCVEIQHRHSTRVLEDYHRLVLLTLIRDFDQRIAGRRYPASVLALYRTYIGNIVAHIHTNPPGFYLHENDLFAKDLAVCRQKLLPCGSQLLDTHSGVPRNFLWKGGIHQFLSLSAFIGRTVGGWRPLYQMHMDLRLILEFNPSGWTRCYRRIADLLELNPSILGVFGTSWWFDPQLETVSPRLAFLRTLPESNGARVFYQGVDDVSTSSALANSHQRQDLYSKGRYRPRNYSLIWSRDDLINWSRTQGV